MVTKNLGTWGMKAGFGAALAASLLLTAAPAMAAEGISLFGPIGQGKGLFETAQNEEQAQAVGEVIALDDLSISIQAAGYSLIEQDEDGFVYVHTMPESSVPYVIIGKYDIALDDIVDAFTAYMAKSYDDLDVDSIDETLKVGDAACTKVVYQYEASGYQFLDTRMFVESGSNTFMFGSKEVPEIDYMLPEGYLEGIAQSMQFLAGGYDDYDLHVMEGLSLEGSGTLAGAFSDQGTGSTTAKGEDPQVDVIVDPAPEPGGEGGIVFDESVAAYDGSWLQFEDGFALYLPNSWEEYEVSAEERESGVLFYAYDPSRAKNPAYVEVDWFANDGSYQSVDQIASDLELAGCDVEGVLNINGIDCAVYSNAEGDLGGLMFFHPMTDDYVIIIVTGSYSANFDTDATILCSLSPIE